MRGRLARAAGQEDGGAALELALLGPLFALLVGGLLEGATLLQSVQVVRNAAREGARYAAVSDASAPNRALNYLTTTFAGRTDIALPAVNCASGPDCITVTGSGLGDSVTVTVPVFLTIDVPLIEKMWNGPVAISESATMRITQ